MEMFSISVDRHIAFCSFGSTTIRESMSRAPHLLVKFSDLSLVLVNLLVQLRIEPSDFRQILFDLFQFFGRFAQLDPGIRAPDYQRPTIGGIEENANLCSSISAEVEEINYRSDWLMSRSLTTASLSFSIVCS